MRITDGHRIVDVTMRIWNGNGYSPDWSQDFFCAGILDTNESLDAYNVDDVEYCIEMANEWKRGIGDYAEDHELTVEEIDDRCVDVDELEFPPVTKDGEYVQYGMWLMDQTGIYEVSDVSHDRVELVEVNFDDDDGDAYTIGERRFLTREEIKRINSASGFMSGR